MATRAFRDYHQERYEFAQPPHAKSVLGRRMVLSTHLHAAEKGLAGKAVECVACQLERQSCYRPGKGFGVLIANAAIQSATMHYHTLRSAIDRSPTQIHTELEALVRMRAIRQHLCDKTFATSRSNICRYDRETCKRNGS